MLLLKMFSRAWLLTTMIVFAGTVLCIRLGIWQLDRLAQRRASNTQVVTMRSMPALDLNSNQPKNINTMEWRAVKVYGEYDFENQIALRNQVYRGEYGFHLIAPLRFEGGVILVDRGFIPFLGNELANDWSQYDEHGVVNVRGQIRLGGEVEVGGNPDALLDGQSQLRFWNTINVEKIAAQMPYPILRVFIQPNIDESDSLPPVAYQPEVNLTEGSNFGYALQWFTFATILFFGYPVYLRNQLAENIK